MGGLVAGCHQVDGVAGAAEEEKLEDEVVEAEDFFGESPKDVEVAGNIDYEVERLGLEGDSGSGLRAVC